MKGTGNRRDRRRLWAGLAIFLGSVILLSLVMAERGKTRGESAATTRAQTAVERDLAPVIEAGDVARPASGARYRRIESAVKERVLAGGAFTGARLLASDGTIVFSMDPAEVGTQDASLAPTIQAALKGRPQSLVSGGEFLTIVRLPVKGQKNPTTVAELARPYAPIWESTAHTWRLAAVALGALLVFALSMLILSFRSARVPVGSVASGANLAPYPQSKRHLPWRASSADPSPAAGGLGSEAGARMAAEDRAAAAEGRAKDAADRTRAAEERFQGTQAELARTLQQLKQVERQAEAARTDRANMSEMQQRLEAKIHLVEAEKLSLQEQLRTAGSSVPSPEIEARLKMSEERAHTAEKRLLDTRRELESAQQRAAAAEEHAKLAIERATTAARQQVAFIEQRATTTERELARLQERVEEYEATERRERLAEALRHLREGEDHAPVEIAEPVVELEHLPEAGPVGSPVEITVEPDVVVTAGSDVDTREVAPVASPEVEVEVESTVEVEPVVDAEPTPEPEHAVEAEHGGDTAPEPEPAGALEVAGPVRDDRAGLVALAEDGTRDGASDDEMNRVRLDELVSHVVGASAAGVARNVSVLTEPVEVDCDPVRASQIVTVLLANAVGRTGADAQIVVRVTGAEGGGRISVEDDEPTAETTLSPIVARLADALGGWAHVEVRDGEGSAIVVFVPNAMLVAGGAHPHPQPQAAVGDLTIAVPEPFSTGAERQRA